MRITFLLILLAATAPGQGASAQDKPFATRYLDQAQRLEAEGKLDLALAAVRKALERDERSLLGLELLFRLARAVNDLDTAVHAMHRWLDLVEAARKRPVSAKELREHLEALLLLDPRARDWSKLQKKYITELQALGRDYERRKDWIAAVEVQAHVLDVDPFDRAAQAAIRRIRHTGGKGVAVEDVFAGADPSFGKTTEQVRAEDRKHAEWKQAWRKQTDNYRYRTDAGFLVLETSAIAMEQIQRFYRRFFHFKENGGKIPKIEIRIFKNRDEYLTLGQNPVPWSGGHFTGGAVETYVGGVTGKESIRDMYRTLFHEAAHQFVSMTGSPPGWLNEAYASFFEGCVIMSNGSVQWNRPPPGRLFPLAKRMEHGWMSGPDDGVRDAAGEWSSPKSAPGLRILVENDYQWGPPWYAPTWGVVYFLYNIRDDAGRTIYREALHEYYDSFKRGRPKDAIGHFEELVLGAKRSPVKKIDELDMIWRRWILDLRDREIGKKSNLTELEHFGDAALERGEKDLALEFFEEALGHKPEDPDLLFKTATLLEERKQKARAVALYRRLARALELLGREEEPRYRQAKRKVSRLDPLAARYQRIKQQLAVDGLELARSYDARGLPTMALEIASRMSARFSLPSALALYQEIAERTGKSLARWRVAYNESTLDGWSGGAGAYLAYGDLIKAQVEPKAPGQLVTHQLSCDVTFDGDFSLEAEMRVEADGLGGFKGSLIGLCFGRKDGQNFHAVMLHPKGFLDIASNRGGVWDISDHRSVPVGDAWHRLRIDVTGKSLDVYLDGYYVRSLEFRSRATVLGSFGLITGVGGALYRNVRLLARDPTDPAARIERALAMKKIAAGLTARQPGTFSGTAPPELKIATWVQGEGVTLSALHGKPVMLAFWSPAQDRVIPTAAYYAHLLEQNRGKGLVLIIVVDGGTSAGELRGHLAAHPIPGARVGIDEDNQTFDAYWVKAGHFGMPRILLIDRDGKVTFEGDPGFKRGETWQSGDPPSYLDGPLERLLGQ